jgi:hypothetical protein
VLFTLPVPAIAPHTQTSPTVLPQRNLLRQLTWGLPSGQQVAKAMGVSPLARADLADIAGVYSPFGNNTHCGTTSWPRPRPRRTVSTLALWRAGSSSRRSSGCCAPMPPATSATSPAGARPSAPTSSSAPTQPEHHRKPVLHPGALPLPRPGGDARHLPLAGVSASRRQPAARGQADTRIVTPLGVVPPHPRMAA